MLELSLSLGLGFRGDGDDGGPAWRAGTGGGYSPEGHTQESVCEKRQQQPDHQKGSAPLSAWKRLAAPGYPHDGGGLRGLWAEGARFPGGLGRGGGGHAEIHISNICNAISNLHHCGSWLK